MTDNYYFYDTNIIYYAYDASGSKKRNIAKSMIEDIFTDKNKEIISNQILVELYNSLTRKLKVNENDAKVIFRGFKSPLTLQFKTRSSRFHAVYFII